jgi:hypothetical protein
MKGKLILIAFFSIFTFASLLIPLPMFPGSFVVALFGDAASGYARFIAPFLNGVFYAMILWLVFAIISGRLGEQK